MSPTELIKKYDDQGLAKVFLFEQGGELFVPKSEESQRDNLSQIGVIVFETIAALGQFPIAEIGVMGSDRGVIIKIHDQKLVGSAFDAGADYGVIQERLGQFIQELSVPVKEKVVEVKVEENIFERIKTECLAYLGDFAEKIYQNQLKATKVNVAEAKVDDVKKLIFGLNKAASMIIGPKRAKEMTDKLLEFIK